MTTTDAMRGQPLAVRAAARRAELMRALESLRWSDPRAREIEVAIAVVDGLTTGDPDHMTDVVARDLSGWLERNKYLAV
jgi:hypothetical protein